MPQIYIGKDDHGNPTGQYRVGENGPIVGSLVEAQALGGYLYPPASGSSNGGGETTPRDWRNIALMVLGVFVLGIVIINAFPDGYTGPRFGDRHHQQPIYQQPVYYREPVYPEDPGFNPPPQSYSQRRIPAGCWQAAPGQIHCPPNSNHKGDLW